MTIRAIASRENTAGSSLLLTMGMSIAEFAEVLGDTVQEVSETYAHTMPDFSKRLRAINSDRAARIAAAREEFGDGRWTTSAAAARSTTVRK